MEQAKPKSKIWAMVLLILLNVAVIAVTAIEEFSGSESAEDVSKVQVQALYLIPAFLCVCLALGVETIKYMRLMKKMCGHADFRVCFETVLFGRYYDNITPSGIGGQPYQIYYMNKCGTPPAAAAAIPLSGFMSMQYGFVLLALFTFIFGGRFMQSDFTRIAGYFGLFMYAFFPTAIMIFTLFPNFAEKCLLSILSFLHRLKIVKDKEKTEKRAHAWLDDYVKCNQELLKTRGFAVEILLYGILYQAFIMAIPYFVTCAFGAELDFFGCFCTTISIYATVTFIPTPGNMGAAEGTFYAVFSSISEGLIFWAMLTWRFLTSYGFILFGIILYISRAIRSRTTERAKHEKRNDSAEIGTND